MKGKIVELIEMEDKYCNHAGFRATVLLFNDKCDLKLGECEVTQK